MKHARVEGLTSDGGVCPFTVTDDDDDDDDDEDIDYDDVVNDDDDEVNGGKNAMMTMTMW